MRDPSVNGLPFLHPCGNPSTRPCFWSHCQCVPPPPPDYGTLFGHPPNIIIDDDTLPDEQQNRVTLYSYMSVQREAEFSGRYAMLCRQLATDPTDQQIALLLIDMLLIDWCGPALDGRVCSLASFLELDPALPIVGRVYDAALLVRFADVLLAGVEPEKT